jgi:O-antigen ligase
MSRTNKIIIWGGLASPLIYSNQLYAGYAAPKAIFFLCIIGVLLFSNHDFNFPKRHVLYALTLVSTLIISSIFGYNFKSSIFSNPLRNTGVLFYLSLIFWILLLAKNIKEEKDWKFIFLISGFVGFVIAAKGIAEENLRPFSTIGNPSEAAAFVLLAIWCLVLFFFLEKSKTKWISLLLIAPMYYFIYLTKTRSAFFALPLSLGVIVLYIFYLKRSKAFLISMVVLVVGGVIMLIFFPNIIQLGRIGNLSFDRIGFQKISINSFIAHPIFGIGLENFLDASYFNYDQSLVRNQNKLDKAHSIFWEWLVSGGIVLFFFLIFMTFKLFKKAQQLTLPLKIAILGFFISYFVWGLFSIDNVSVLIPVATLVAYLLSKNQSTEPSLSPKLLKITFQSLAFGLLVYAGLLTENMIKLSDIRESTDINDTKKIVQNMYSSSIFPSSTLEELSLKSDNIENAEIAKTFINFVLDQKELFNTDSPQNYNIKTHLYARIGNTQDALKNIEISLQKAPHFAFSQRQLAVLKLQANQPKEASEVFEKYIVEFPLDITAKLQLAAIQSVYLGNKTRAFKIVRNLDLNDQIENLKLISQIFSDNESKEILRKIMVNIVENGYYVSTENYDTIVSFYCLNNLASEFNTAIRRASYFLFLEEKKKDFESKFLKNNLYSCNDKEAIMEYFYVNHEF